MGRVGKGCQQYIVHSHIYSLLDRNSFNEVPHVSVSSKENLDSTFRKELGDALTQSDRLNPNLCSRISATGKE